MIASRVLRDSVASRGTGESSYTHPSFLRNSYSAPNTEREIVNSTMKRLEISRINAQRMHSGQQHTHNLHNYGMVYPWAHSPLVPNVHSLPHWVSFQTIGTGSGILGFRPCWCPSPFSLCLPNLGVSPSTLPVLPLDMIRVSSL